MAMPPEVTQALSAGGGGGAGADAGMAPPTDPNSTPPNPGPGAAPMMTPQVASGNIKQGILQAGIALKMLEQSLISFGAHTPEGQAVNKAITLLGKVMGKQVASSSNLMDSEKQAIAGTPPPALASPPTGAPPPGGPPMGAPPGAPPSLG